METLQPLNAHSNELWIMFTSILIYSMLRPPHSHKPIETSLVADKEERSHGIYYWRPGTEGNPRGIGMTLSKPLARSRRK